MYFCTRCMALDIRLRKFISHPGADDNSGLREPIYSLGRLDEIRNNYKTCMLCRLVFAIFRSGPLKKINKITDLHHVAIFAEWINALGPSKAERVRSPTTAILVWAEAPNVPQGLYKVILRVNSTAFPTQPHFGYISPTRSSFLDFQKIQSWMKHCQLSHTRCTKTWEHNPTEEFFLIDTRFNSIVKPEKSCDYLALSYVWGDVTQYLLSEDNLERFKERGSIKPAHTTATIRDAMVLTERLGERYLWVDALCIVQDSEATKQQTLRDMGRIYAQSKLTIVAGACSSANDPLLGVTEPRTWSQWHQKMSPSLTLSAHFDFKDFLENSKYSSRAWTFQEYQLAERMLIFASNGQVSFSCNSAVYSDEVITGARLDTDAAMFQGAEMIKLRSDSSQPWSTYQRAVEAYTKRFMTKPKDVINAFSGMLNALTDARCVEGIPVPLLTIAILWQPRQRLKRRSGFSSWSWAGWEGKVHWPGKNLLNDLCEDVQSETKALEAWTKSRTWIVWYSSRAINCRSTAFRSEGPAWLHGTRPDEDLHNGRFCSWPQNVLPTPSLLPDALECMRKDQDNTRYLQFWTFHMCFRIELETTAVLHYTSLDPQNTGNGLRRFAIHDAFRNELGWVLLDEVWIETAVCGLDVQEFILLSEATSHENVGFNASSAGEPGKRDFNTMMISWEGGIAERKGLGRVCIDATLMSTMEWKEILLG